MNNKDYNLVAKREFDELARMVKMIESFTVNNNLDESINFLLNLATEELFTNMVKYSPSGTGDITMQLQLVENEVIITLIDHGVPEFDIRTAPSAAGDQPLEDRRIGGLGLHLIKEMMDEVDYLYRDGNSIIILKKSLENRNA